MPVYRARAKWVWCARVQVYDVAVYRATAGIAESRSREPTTQYSPGDDRAAALARCPHSPPPLPRRCARAYLSSRSSTPCWAWSLAEPLRMGDAGARVARGRAGSGNRRGFFGRGWVGGDGWRGGGGGGDGAAGAGGEPDGDGDGVADRGAGALPLPSGPGARARARANGKSWGRCDRCGREKGGGML